MASPGLAYKKAFRLIWYQVVHVPGADRKVGVVDDYFFEGLNLEGMRVGKSFARSELIALEAVTMNVTNVPEAGLLGA